MTDLTGIAQQISWTLVFFVALLSTAVGVAILIRCLKGFPEAARPEMPQPWPGLLIAVGFYMCAQLLANVPAGLIAAGIGPPSETLAEALVKGWYQQMVWFPALMACTSLAHVACAGALLWVPVILGRSGVRVFGIGVTPWQRGMVQALILYIGVVPTFFGVSFLTQMILQGLGAVPSLQLPVEIFVFHRLVGGAEVPWLLAAGVVLAAPLVEELVFRGFLFGALARQFGVTVGVVVSGLVFGAIHGNLFGFAPLAGLGMLLAITYHRSGSLWPCIFLHAVFNGVQMLFLVYITR